MISNEGIYSQVLLKIHILILGCVFVIQFPSDLGFGALYSLGDHKFYVCPLNQKCIATSHSALLEFHLVHSLLIYRQVSSFGKKRFPGIGWHF